MPPSRIPKAPDAVLSGTRKRPRLDETAQLVTIGKRAAIAAKLSHAVDACATSIGHDDRIVILRGRDKTHRCASLLELAERLFFQHRADEPLRDTHDNTISEHHFRRIVSAARDASPDFDALFRRAEIERVVNHLVKPDLVAMHDALHRLRQRLDAEELTIKEFKAEKLKVQRAFDLRRHHLQERASEAFASLSGTQMLTSSKVGTKADVEAAEAFHEAVRTRSPHR